MKVNKKEFADLIEQILSGNYRDTTLALQFCENDYQNDEDLVLALTTLVDALQKRPENHVEALTTLDLSNNNLGSNLEFLRPLSNLLFWQPVKNIILDNNGIGDEGVVKFVGIGLGLRNSLNVLSLRGNHIGARGVYALGRAITYGRYRRDQPALPILRLDNNKIGDAALEDICKIIVGTPDMIELGLSNNQLSDRCSLDLAKNLIERERRVSQLFPFIDKVYSDHLVVMRKRFFPAMKHVSLEGNPLNMAILRDKIIEECRGPDSSKVIPSSVLSTVLKHVAENEESLKRGNMLVSRTIPSQQSDGLIFSAAAKGAVTPMEIAPQPSASAPMDLVATEPSPSQRKKRNPDKFLLINR